MNKPQWVTKRYNLGLMQVARVIVNRGTETEVLPMQFGNTVQDVGKVIGNARSETILEKRTFKKQLSSHRCLVPTSGFIDWETDEEGRKWPHLFTLAHGCPYAMAAIFEIKLISLYKLRIRHQVPLLPGGNFHIDDIHDALQADQRNERQATRSGSVRVKTRSRTPPLARTTTGN